MNEEINELIKRHSDGQNKYTYFLLAVSASAVAFAMQKTDGLKLTYSLIPLGISIIFFGISFYFGVKCLNWIQDTIYSNVTLLKLKTGSHPEQPNQRHVQSAVSGTRYKLENSIHKIQIYAAWQFRLLLCGAIMFVVWHILEMAIRTYGQ